MIVAVSICMIGIGGVLLYNAKLLNAGIKSGQLKITLGEDLLGYSYQYAFSLVFGYLGIFVGCVLLTQLFR